MSTAFQTLDATLEAKKKREGEDRRPGHDSTKFISLQQTRTCLKSCVAGLLFLGAGE